MFNYKNLIVSILIPNLVGILSNFLGNSSMGYQYINKPSFTPPSIVFPITWILLFTVMGISSYLIYKSNNPSKKKALFFYALQLGLNCLWTLFFFNLKWYLFAFIWIILIIVLVIIMIIKFYKINKIASLIQIPYLLWLIFASVLTYNAYLLN